MGKYDFHGRIALVGPKHTGKSSVGRAIIQVCPGVFMDLDDIVQRQTGKSPRELFEAGAECFRRAEESAVLFAVESAMQTEGLVVMAAGGGIIDNGPAFDALRKNAILVYLDLPAATAWDRIEASAARTGALPPFLRTADPQESHRMLHERRAAAYGPSADLIVAVHGKKPAFIAREVLRELQKGRENNLTPLGFRLY